MRWEELLFLHWRAPASAIQRLLPPGLKVETFDGTAWLGVVPFRMAAVRPRWLPPIPTAHTFPELNVRTYVRSGDTSGVWFFSLDAASRLAVEAARLWCGLPYFHAHMLCSRRGEIVQYVSERCDRHGPAATFAANWRTTGPVRAAAPGSLEHFLTERYCLFSLRRGVLLRLDIAHEPWQLAPAEVVLQTCEMWRGLGLEPTGDAVSALAAKPQTVAAWSPVRV